MNDAGAIYLWAADGSDAVAHCDALSKSNRRTLNHVADCIPCATFVFKQVDAPSGTERRPASNGPFTKVFNGLDRFSDFVVGDCACKLDRRFERTAAGIEITDVERVDSASTRDTTSFTWRTRRSGERESTSCAIEVRTKDIVISVLIFALLVLAIFNFAINPTSQTDTEIQFFSRKIVERKQANSFFV